MRTIIGPLCKNCEAEMVRVETQNEHGYVHGRWEHKYSGYCLRPNVTWMIKDD